MKEKDFSCMSFLPGCEQETQDQAGGGPGVREQLDRGGQCVGEPTQPFTSGCQQPRQRQWQRLRGPEWLHRADAALGQCHRCRSTLADTPGEQQQQPQVPLARLQL